MLITSHSPFLLNAIRAEDVRILYRNEEGFTQATKAAEIRGILELLNAGATLGNLWLEGHFGLGDPLTSTQGTVAT